MKTGLTKKQKVTELFYNAKDPIAEIYTHDTKLKKRLLAFAKDYPDLCWQTDDDGQGGLRFEIAKERVSIRLTAPYSQERREAASRLAKQNSTFQNAKLRNSNELEGTNTDSELCFPRKCDKIIQTQIASASWTLAGRNAVIIATVLVGASDSTKTVAAAAGQAA